MFFFDFIFPLKVVSFILNLIFGGRSGDPTIPAQPIDPGIREWFSQPRIGTDPGVETITTIFKLPLSVSEVSIDILRVPCTLEMWYQDRSNNWRQVLDMQRLPLRVSVSRSDVKSYYTYRAACYPIVAKQFRFQIRRNNDPTLENIPYVVGLRNGLIRRNVYNRSGGTASFEDEVDIMGNVISKYVKDWDAVKAVDDNPNTFWKSAPLPDPLGVCSLYLDVRKEDGKPNLIDKLYIDPVYSNQHLNLYYSSDDSVGVRKLNPVTIPPDEDENTDWRLGTGRRDVSTGVESSFYRWTMGLGPMLSQDTWIGIEWVPEFGATDVSLPPVNPVLLSARALDTTLGYKPTVYYDVGAGEFVLEFNDGTDTITYSAAMSTTTFAAGDSVRILVGWRYGDPDEIRIHVLNQAGATLVDHTGHPTDLPDLVTWDGSMEIADFAGVFRAHVVKTESYTLGYTGDATMHAFHVSPTYYVDPDPVIPDVNGIIPSTTLDNAVYAASWVSQEHASGGSHETAFDDKEWTPIWRDYVTQKGMMYFPNALSMKYLKLEFTNLTEEPYPIYDSGLEVKYKVFPVSVTQQSSLGPRIYTGSGGFLGLGSFISINGVKSVNWLNPGSVLEAVSSIVNTQTPAVLITQGPGFVTDIMPNTADDPSLIENSRRVEAGSAYVYRREALNPYILAEDATGAIIKAEGLQVIQPYTDVPWSDIEAANPGAISHVRSTGALPVRGTDWWIFPGQTLKIPASVMQRLTSSSTVVERKVTLEHRVRFNSTSVHRYEYKTLKRDAGIAYFAGLREVIPFTSTYITGEDKPYFDFAMYDPDQWVQNRVRQTESGPLTTDGKFYLIDNPLFARGIRVGGELDPWIIDSGIWRWDGTVGHWGLGTARLSADNDDSSLLSSRFTADEGDEINISCWVQWDSLIANNSQPAIALRANVYNDDTDTVSSVLDIDDVTYADWSAHTSNPWVKLSGTITVPSGCRWIRVRLGSLPDAVSGTIWFDYVQLAYNGDTDATLFKSFETMSTFSKVAVDFRDSGLVRSDSMWADIVPDSQSIDDTKLAYYVNTIPSTIPGGMWGDTNYSWGAEDTEWGSPFGIVSVTVDGNRRYQGKRVIHFRRAAGAGQAGIKVRQWTNFTPLGLFRIGAVFYKPLANDNEITLRLRRLSDGVFVYEESATAPVGRWFEYVTKFIEIPDSEDQEYEVSLTLSGDAEDELYLSDLYCEIANIRYFVRLGGLGSFTHEVTDLRYAPQQTVYVSATLPVNEMAVSASILSPKAYAFGARITPTYLK